jgi:adenine-specific DNA-methyltransferase
VAKKKKADKKPIEQYHHKGKQRVNNPPVGLVTPETDSETGKKTYSYDPHLDPQLQWAGKAEHTSFEVPTVSLHVHERIDPKTIIEAVRKKNSETPQQMSLFELKEENPPLREAIEEIDRIYDRYHPKIEKALEKLNIELGKVLKEWEIPYDFNPSWPESAKEPFDTFHRLKRDMQQKMDESIQRNAPQETLYDQPLIDRSKTRVSGPFTVEAVPAPAVKPISEIAEAAAPYDAAISRSGETLRQSEWRDELFRTGIRGKGGQRIEFSRVEPLSGTRWLQADAETKEDNPQRVVISFGPEHAPLEQRQVSLAIEEAQKLVPRPKIIVFAAFQFDPEAAKDIDETDWPGVTLLKVQMNADLLTEDLKKKRASNESFWLIGQPDVKLEAIKKGKDKGKYIVEVQGFDYYNTRTGTIEFGGSEKIALWMLDTDYDGRSIYPRQVFFPMAGEKEGWSRLAKNLKAEIDEELIEAYRGTVSLPWTAFTQLEIYYPVMIFLLPPLPLRGRKALKRPCSAGLPATLA